MCLCATKVTIHIFLKLIITCRMNVKHINFDVVLHSHFITHHKVKKIFWHDVKKKELYKLGFGRLKVHKSKILYNEVND